MLGETSRFTVRQPRENLERHKSLVMFRSVLMFLLTEERGFDKLADMQVEVLAIRAHGEA